MMIRDGQPGLISSFGAPNQSLKLTAAAMASPPAQNPLGCAEGDLRKIIQNCLTRGSPGS